MSDDASPNASRRPNKTDAGTASKAIGRVSNVLRSPSPDPKRSAKTMRRNTPLSIYSVFTFLVLFPKLVFAETPIEWADWSEYFDAANAQGTIVVSDERSGGKETLAFDTVRSGKRFSPASTFKIPHALFALEAGVIRDEFETKVWDGVKRSFPGWNQDQKSVICGPP